MRVLPKLTASLAVAGAVAAFGFTSASAQEQRFISIGTGGVTGVYYPTGGAICRLVNKARKEAWHPLRGRIDRRFRLQHQHDQGQGELEFGVAQSDWQYHAYNGTSKFEENRASSRTCGRSSRFTPSRSPLVLSAPMTAASTKLRRA